MICEFHFFQDFAIAAATEAYSQFSALLHGHCSDNDDDEFILADTEEDSDDSIDLELSHADFWYSNIFLSNNGN